MRDVLGLAGKPWPSLHPPAIDGVIGNQRDAARSLRRTDAQGENMRLQSLIAISTLVFGSLSCSSTLEPRSNVTLLVTNASCALGPCATLAVLAFPAAAGSSGGPWSLNLGTMTGSQICITIPTSSTFTANDAGDITKTVWNTAEPMALGAEPPAANYFQASPSTSDFVPATAAGWSITLPGGTQAVPGPSCTP
jgi:hypothetical protein